MHGRREGVLDDRLQRLPHQALALAVSVDGVAQHRVLERTTEDLAQADAAHQARAVLQRLQPPAQQSAGSHIGQRLGQAVTLESFGGEVGRGRRIPRRQVGGVALVESGSLRSQALVHRQQAQACGLEGRCGDVDDHRRSMRPLSRQAARLPGCGSSAVSASLITEPVAARWELPRVRATSLRLRVLPEDSASALAEDRGHQSP